MPTYDMLVNQGTKQKPPVKLTVQSLSDWINGNSVPAGRKRSPGFAFLVSYLESRAAARTPGHHTPSPATWEAAREAAWRERHANKGGRPRSNVRPIPDGTRPVLPGRPVSEFTDPFTLEVHPAVEVATAPGSPALAALPLYVKRQHDSLLAEVVDRATHGDSRIAILVGGSSTGKTRACWEVVRTLPPEWRLWHPIDPSPPEAALAELHDIGPHTVVWLNECQHYLLPGALGERVAAGLRDLIRSPDRAPVLILGTIWPGYWDDLTAEPSRDTPDVHAQARALIANTAIPVPGAFYGADLDNLREAAASDPRLAAAARYAEEGQITQYLAGGPALLTRYRTAVPTAKAVIEAAMDACRLGHGLVLCRELLAAAAPAYLTQLQLDEAGEAWLDEALADTSRPTRGVRGPLAPLRSSKHDLAEPRYKLADFLAQHGQAARRSLPPLEMWNALIDHAIDINFTDLAELAAVKGLFRLAIRMYTIAGDPYALYSAARLLQRAGRTDEAIVWFQRAGFPDALSASAWLLEHEGRTDEAVTWYERAGHEMGLLAAAKLIANSEGTDKAVAWLERRADADAGTADAPLAAALLLKGPGQTDEAITWYQRAADAGSPMAALEAARLLKDVGRTGEAITWSMRAADMGHRDGPWWVAVLLEGAGQTDEALTWYQRAADIGPPAAVEKAARLLESSEGIDSAIAWLEQRADAGDHFALKTAVGALALSTGIDDAIAWLEQRGDAQFAAREVALQLEREGRTGEAITWFQQAANDGDHFAEGEAAHLLEREGRIDEAITLHQQAANDGDLVAAVEAARLLEGEGQIDEAITWYQQAGLLDSDAAMEATRLLEREGRTDEAITWYQQVADYGDHFAAGEAARLLEREGRTDEAITWYQRAANMGGPDAAGEAARLLEREGRTADAVTRPSPEAKAHLLRYGREPDGTVAEPWEAWPPAK